ncbi:glycosyltransferase family 2 protein [Mycobacterium sp. GA-2829]|uniref:glycosyltransferase family 2 protein n=1 Tax=Mycobacterium sp. GA-2829 TaxID=1772283 RepID=UPI000A6201D7|nr:glycosyltransferase [Mycobacterium sp. GA-2829]
MTNNPERLPIVAAIPNYNMGSHLRRLLPQVLEQGYDHVYVLDDASTDESVEVVSGFGDAVTMVRSGANQGAGANRNQIIGQVDDATVIHFIDADMDIATPRSADVARELFARYAPDGVGAIGGLVRRADGSQEPFNYGPVFALRTNVTSVPWMVDRIRHHPRLVAVFRRTGMPGTRQWPNILDTPKPTETYWLHEGNMLIHAGAFRRIGGYDRRLRSHEAQDLAIRLDGIGVKRRFDPGLEVVHHYIDVRGKNRSRYERDAVRYLIRKHGVVRFLTDH